MWMPIICQRIRCFWSGIFSLRWLRQLSPLGPSRGGPAGTFSFHSMPALLHLGISTSSGGLGVECLQPSSDISGKLHVSPSCINSSGSVQVSGRTCLSQLRQLILVAMCWMEVPWLPTVLNMLVEIPWQCLIIKDLTLDVSVGQGLKGLPYLHLTICLLSSVYYEDKGALPKSVRQWQGQLEHLHQRSTNNLGRNGQVCVLNRMYQTMPSLLLN